MTLGGSFGLFFTLFLLFCRYLPMVAMSEVKAFSPAGGHARGHLHHAHDDAHGEAAHAHH
jgi:molybdopterin-containing oxidoreductase family membrane subunit